MTPKTNHNIITSRQPIATICVLAVLRNPTLQTLRWCHLGRHLNWSPQNGSPGSTLVVIIELSRLIPFWTPTSTGMIDGAWNTSTIQPDDCLRSTIWSRFFAANSSLTLENTWRSCCNLEVWKVVSFRQIMARLEGISGCPDSHEPHLNVTQSQKVASAIDHYQTRRIVWANVSCSTDSSFGRQGGASSSFQRRCQIVQVTWDCSGLATFGDNPFASKQSWQSVSRSKLKITMNHSTKLNISVSNNRTGTPTTKDLRRSLSSLRMHRA